MSRYIKDIYYIAVFDSKNHAVQLYQHLKRMRFNQFQLIPTPSMLKVGCSYSIEFDELEDYRLLVEEAEGIDKRINSVYEVKRENRNRVLKKLEFN